jgi:murein DD-endopeptidase MepM/ murein hydrolase activator NlpD
VGKGGFRPDIRYGSSPIKGYDFYDGNLHGGHPAYDIFIADKNMDCRDDRTHRPILVIAPIDLFVLSVFSNWKTGSDLRGGNYIWALDLPHNRLFYFAHLDSIIARSGEFLSAGDALGTVGRSGINAAVSRSPTHLHMMVLDVQGATLRPFDFWNMLEKK